MRAVRAIDRGNLMARVSGHIVAFRRLHTLQLSTGSHLFDPYFTGLLLHSCDPNVRLDMGSFEVWALRNIQAGELLTMDYATTEDILMRQFECHCGAPNCRHWITGAKELPNAQGRQVLEQRNPSASVFEHELEQANAGRLRDKQTNHVEAY